MIAANGVTARYLAARKFPSIRLVVRTPAMVGNTATVVRGGAEAEMPLKLLVPLQTAC